MELHPKTKEPSHSVPLGFRSTIAQVFNVGPLKGMGKAYYRWVAHSVAEQLRAERGVEKIILFGGGLDRCVPAVSDLDLLLVQNAGEHEEKLLLNLRQRYFQRFRKYLLIGEIHVTTSPSWSLVRQVGAAPIHWFRSQHRFEGGKWRKVAPNLGKRTPTEALLGLCLNHYGRAYNALIRSHIESRFFYLSNFYREISKAIDFASRKDLELRSGEPAELLAQAFLAMKELAEDVSMKNSTSPDVTVEFGKDAPARFANEILNRYWQTEIGKYKDYSFRFETTTAPRIVLWEGGVDQTRTMFRHYVKFLAGSISSGRSQPHVFSKSMFECYLRGWSYAPLMEHLDWVPVSHREDDEWLGQFGAASISRLRERAVFELAVVRGKFVTQKLERAEAALRELCICTFALAGSCLSRNLETLVDLGSQSLPETTRLARKLFRRSQSGFSEMSQLVAEALPALKEMELFFHRTPRANA